jgi:hypothetical protein
MKIKYAVVYTGDSIDTVMCGNRISRAAHCAQQHYGIDHTFILHRNAEKALDNLLRMYALTLNYDIDFTDRQIEYSTHRLKWYKNELLTAIMHDQRGRAGAMKRQVNRVTNCIAKDREELSKLLDELALVHVKPVPFVIVGVQVAS